MSDDTRNRTREGHLPDLPDGELATFHGPKCIGRYRSDGSPIKQEDRKQEAA